MRARKPPGKGVAGCSSSSGRCSTLLACRRDILWTEQFRRRCVYASPADRGRSASPYSVSGRSTSALSGVSGSSHPSSLTSRTSSPGLSALSRSEYLESGGVLPLGNLLDPVCPPQMFARHQLPDWSEDE